MEQDIRNIVKALVAIGILQFFILGLLCGIWTTIKELKKGN